MIFIFYNGNLKFSCEENVSHNDEITALYKVYIFQIKILSLTTVPKNFP